MFNPQFSGDDIIIDGARTVSQNSELDLNRQDNKGADLTVTYELENGFTLKSITAQKTYDSLLSDDFDNTGLNMAMTNQREDNSQFTQEIQLLSPADDTFSYVAGVFYLDNDAENFQDLQGLEHLYFFAPVGRSVESESEVENKSLAAFVHGTYDFSEDLSGFLGLRYSTVEKNVVLEQRSALNYQGGNLFGMVNISDYDETLDDSFLSWTVGLNYDLESTFSVPSMVYGKISRGYKEGGFTVRLHTLGAVGGDAENPNIEFEREQATSYELGMKGTLMDQRLRLNAAVFYLDYEDIQTTLLDDDGSFRVENGPAATSQGVELEVTYLLNEYLTFGTNVGYSKARFEDFEACSGSVDCTGNSIPRASDVTGNVSLNGRYPINDSWALFGGVDYSYRSESYLGATNNDLTELDAVNLLNAGVGLESLDTGLTIQAYVKNARDEEYFTSMGDKSTGDLAVTFRRYGAPRTYGLRVSYEF
jgi:iron complex outermembrane receptor protein